MAPDLPKSFKAARFMEKDAPLTLEEVELKQPGEGEVLIKVLAVGVCHSDAMVPTGVMGNPLSVVPAFKKPIVRMLTSLVALEHLATKRSAPSLPWDLARSTGKSVIVWALLGMEGMMVQSLLL